jgi:hypothetical protein
MTTASSQVKIQTHDTLTQLLHKYGFPDEITREHLAGEDGQLGYVSDCIYVTASMQILPIINAMTRAHWNAVYNLYVRTLSYMIKLHPLIKGTDAK